MKRYPRKPGPGALGDDDPARTRYLYYWLLLALFLEYARPASFLPFLQIPFFYSAVPLLLVLVSCYAKGLRPAKEIFADPAWKWLAGYLALITISLPLADVTEFSFDVFRMAAGYTLLFIMMTRILTTEERVRGVITVLMIAHVFLLAMNIQVILVPDRSRYIEGATFLGDGNDFALSICVLFPFTIETALSARSFFTKLIAWSSMGVAVLAIVATQSRGATLGIGAVFIYLWLRSSRKLLTIFGFLIVGVIVLLYAPPEYYQRVAGISHYQEDGSAMGRIDAWKAGLRMVAHNPLFGVSTGHFPVAYGTKFRPPGMEGPWLNAHSMYFQAMGELGLPGLLCLVVLVWGGLRWVTKLRGRILKHAGPKPGPESVRLARTLYLVGGACVGLGVAGTFLSAAYYPHVFVLSALLLSVRHIVAKKAGIPVLEPAPPTAREKREAKRRLAAAASSVADQVSTPAPTARRNSP